MALTNSQHDAIMRTYDAIRTENRHIQNERYAQVTAACPEIAQIEDDIIGLSMQAAAEMLKNPDYKTAYRKKLSELAKIMKVYPQVLINVRVTPQGKEKYNNNEYIISAVQQAEMELMGEGRVLVRVSGTEPLIRVMLEGSDLDKITVLGNKIANVVKERLS